MKTDNLKDHIAGALYGVAIGDALGAPLEFMNAEQIKRRYGTVTEMIGGGWLNVRPGETTDDTAMTLAVAEGIMRNPDNPIPVIGGRFIQWAKSGPKDIGGTCRGAICRAAAKSQPWPSESQWRDASKETAVFNQGRSGGNGALMRAVYPPLFYRDKAKALDIEERQGLMTHFNMDSVKACELYAAVIYYLITEAEKGHEEEKNTGRVVDSILRPTTYNLDAIGDKGRNGDLKPTGYVVDSLECALYAFWSASEDFENAIIYAANLGGDADTIAAICGGLAGAYYGYKAIPERWIAAISKADRERLDAAVEAAVENRRRP